MEIAFEARVQAFATPSELRFNPSFRGNSFRGGDVFIPDMPLLRFNPSFRGNSFRGIRGTANNDFFTTVSILLFVEIAFEERNHDVPMLPGLRFNPSFRGNSFRGRGEDLVLSIAEEFQSFF